MLNDAVDVDTRSHDLIRLELAGLDELFEMQDRLAELTAESLSVVLPERGAVGARRLDSYELMERARKFQGNFTTDGIAQSHRHLGFRMRKLRVYGGVPVPRAAVEAIHRVRAGLRGAEELRVKESDRIASMAEGLATLGIRNEVLDDGIIIDGGTLGVGVIRTFHDHRIAMSATLLGLLADGETLIDGAEAVDTSFPGFVDLLRSLGADITEETR